MLNIESIDRALKAAFLKIKAEFMNVKLWIDFFNDKFIKNELEHNEIKEIINEQNKKLEFLVVKLNDIENKTSVLEKNIESLRMSERKNLEQEINEIKSVHNDIKELFETLKLELSKQKDMIRTRPGHDKDMSGHVRTHKDISQDMNKEKNFLLEKEIFEEKNIKYTSGLYKKEKAVVEKNERMSVTEKSLLRILYETDSPLTYADLSRMLGREEKTIRNAIYELRKKGFDIHDKLVSSKEKAFYLPKELKLKISGR
ncbi:MAG: HTH domain-containing protein [Candidatus Woesearchaeota archaeon]